MKYACLALWLLCNVVACSRGGSTKSDAGGGAAGGPQGGEASSQAGEAGGTESGGESQPATTGGAGVTSPPATTGGAGVTGGASGGATTSSVSTAASGGVAGTNPVAGQTDAGQSAEQDGGSGASCGIQVVPASRTTPDVLLVLDRSASMDNSLAEEKLCKVDAGATCRSRWNILQSALSTAIAGTPSLRWGLKLFPSGASGSCAVSAGIEVEVGADAGPVMLNAIKATTPAGNTPTRAAILAAATYLKAVDDQNSKYIVLATDGLPNCGGGGLVANDPDLVGTVDAIQHAGFPVYVVGIGPESALMNLQELSHAGGTGDYLAATSPDQLTAALTSIAGTVASCTFKLSATPPFLGGVTVTLEQTPLAKDEVNGWGFAGDSRTIELHGDACAKLKASATSTLTVRVDCPR
jgi:Mg-chelatase subunit ChlD